MRAVPHSSAGEGAPIIERIALSEHCLQGLWGQTWECVSAADPGRDAQQLIPGRSCWIFLERGRQAWGSCSQRKARRAALGNSLGMCDTACASMIPGFSNFRDHLTRWQAFRNTACVFSWYKWTQAFLTSESFFTLPLLSFYFLYCTKNVYAQNHRHTAV